VTRGQLPQRAGSLGLNGGGAAAAVPTQWASKRSHQTSYAYAIDFNYHNTSEGFVKTAQHWTIIRLETDTLTANILVYHQMQ